MSPPVQSREAAHRFGLRAETWATWLLRLKGYRILARRYRRAGGEIDIIARQRGIVAFVEVKARDDMESALSAITKLKRRRMSRAARAWVGQNQWAMQATLRADAIFVAPGHWPRHEPNAFELDFDERGAGA